MSGLSVETLFFIFGSSMVLLLIIAVFSGIFTVLMLRDCLQRNFSKKNIWLATILLFNIIGALLYYAQVKENKVKFINKKSKK